MASKKASTTMTPAAPKAPRGPSELLANLSEWVGYSIDGAKREIKESIARQQKLFTNAMTALDDAANYWNACYEIGQTYWPLAAMHEANGKLHALLVFKKSLDEAQKIETDSLAILEQLAATNATTAIEDNDRSENSTNPYSNAKSGSNGEGRGRIYRDINNVLTNYIAEAEVLTTRPHAGSIATAASGWAFRSSEVWSRDGANRPGPRETPG